MTATAALTASSCAVCGRPLTDAISIELAIGPDCRATYNYIVISSLADDERVEAHRIIHAIAADALYGTQLRDALFRLSTLNMNEIAQRIERRVRRRLMPVEPVVPFVDVFEPPVPQVLDLPFTLTQGQDQACDAVKRIMNVRGFGMCVVAGYAGTGKTTVLKAFSQLYGKPVVITPTGRAALRVKEATGLSASTIHRWMYAPMEDPRTGVMKFDRRRLEDIPVPASRLVLMDESSMVGPDVWKDVYGVCKALDLKLVCVGDAFQLPPVQPPNAPAFSILSPEFAVQHGAERIELTEVLRQALDSPIIRASMELRRGVGVQALRELTRVEEAKLGPVAVAVHAQGGITICHRNATRFTFNARMRATLGIHDEQPQEGEPLMVLKNSYDAGVVNGETVRFGAWQLPAEIHERVHDRFKNVEESTRFGATLINDKTQVVLSLEELHGRLTAGPRAIEIASSKWARLNNLTAGDTLAPHLHANFGYAYTCHRAQGSEWPFVLILLESSIRLNEEDGRRWMYTSITRGSKMVAVFTGKLQ